MLNVCMTMCISVASEPRDIRPCHFQRFHLIKWLGLFLSPWTHWPSASSCASDMKLSRVIDKRMWGGWGVIHGRWSVSPPFAFFYPGTCTVQGMEALCVFFCAFLTSFYIMIHTIDLPCQQDKTAVVKQSKQSPMTATMSVWCDLQTGFLLPSLAILWQAQETHSALPDKKLD